MGRWTRTILVAALAVAALAAPAVASASDPYAGLLAPESACPGENDAYLPAATQEQTMLCLHRWARHQSHLSGLHVSKQLRAS